MNDLGLGTINGHAVGVVLKEAVRRSMTAILRERLTFEAHAKDGYSGGVMDDVFTSADKAAQDVCIKMLRECFPDAGILAEEDYLTIKPQNGCRAYFTLDPLDGTKAFVRRQSHGVGSMIALVVDGEVVSAYIGDVNADEIYGYRPDSDSVWRINRLDSFEALRFTSPYGKGNNYILLRDPAETYSEQSQRLIRGRFKKSLVDGGSIGLWAARLWKREVAALLVPPGVETPWDSTPFIGISRKLGYEFYRPFENNVWQKFDPVVPQELLRRSEDMLIVHAHDVPQVFSANA